MSGLPLLGWTGNIRYLGSVRLNFVAEALDFAITGITTVTLATICASRVAFSFHSANQLLVSGSRLPNAPISFASTDGLSNDCSL
jgi:hypothetical protein